MGEPMGRMIRCIINRESVTLPLPPGSVALDVIRKYRRLSGTKEGCREGECGACTVLLGELTGVSVTYRAVASCLLPLGELDGKHVVTIEGVSGYTLSPIQQALVDEGASQCGFCTPGFVLGLTGFFLNSPTLDGQEAIHAVDGNLCRCTGYFPIQRAAQKLCATYAPQLDPHHPRKIDRVKQLVSWSILPEYFLDIPGQLRTLAQPLPNPPVTEHTLITAGATDLYIQKPHELRDKELFFVSHCDTLSQIRECGSWVLIGGGVTVTQLQQDPVIRRHFPRMSDYLYLVSSTLMRNRATLAGNIVNASPIGDLTILFLALGAHISVRKGETRREFPLHEFFKGYKQLDLLPGEIVETIEIPLPPPGVDVRFHFEKVSRRPYLDIASCNTAIYLEVESSERGRTIIRDVRVSAGGVAPIPLLLNETNHFLRKKEIAKDTIREAFRLMEFEITPISDVRGSAAYKTRLIRHLFLAHFITLFPEKEFEDLVGGEQ
ncbi:MAG: FAD binding domain-containing protein [Candidatus Omnitrophota bacterium]